MYIDPHACLLDNEKVVPNAVRAAGNIANAMDFNLLAQSRFEQKGLLGTPEVELWSKIAAVLADRLSNSKSVMPQNCTPSCSYQTNSPTGESAVERVLRDRQPLQQCFVANLVSKQ